VRAHSVALLAALFCLSSVAAADPPASPSGPACTPPGSIDCPTYDRYENHKFGFVVDVPSFFVRKPADADGRGQPFEYGTKVRVRAWAMYDNPPMTSPQLYADWTRREGVTFKTLVTNTWVVRGKEGSRFYYSRSILADGIITTIEVSYAPDVADAIEPVLARMGASLTTTTREGVRAAH
jgi:hypothetical protein